MYKNYEIKLIDTTEKMVVFKFTKEDFRPYITRRYYEGALSEEKLLNLAKDSQIEAAIFYQRENSSAEFTPESWTGILKDIEVDSSPDYDPESQYLQETWEETETARTRTFTVHNLSDEDRASAIRRKRDELLKMTDNSALADRTLSSEMATYRQALRDLTTQETFPTSVTWPVKPTE